MCIEPCVGFASPVNILNVEVLPAPFVPSKAKQSPYSSAKETCLQANIGLVHWLYIFQRLKALTANSLVVSHTFSASLITSSSS